MAYINRQGSDSCLLSLRAPYVPGVLNLGADLLSRGNPCFNDWLVEIFQLLCSLPWPLPLHRDLLTQAHGEIFHPHPDHMALWA
ncbi:hypothetical protein N1851_000559 [Merluccius polli]|uniref:Uncharacterized protein n=1 Tax=Merluccius polli TaxID=89951 RepID=A0AA47NDF1_MERPO|nr:hypothetical protein N1851_000559 [Merluccius polli]